YSYIAGDITAAYDPQKVDRVTRSMLTINTGDSDFPALFFVFDRILSDRTEYKKTWLLHSIQEPEITGNVFSISRTGPDYKAEGIYNGKLVCRTILPKNASITKVGGTGREFWVEASQTNYFVEKDNPASEPGAWRIEVSPANAQEDDLFFHAMAVTQADNKRICDFEPFDAGTYKAVKTNKYLVMFNSVAKGATDVQFTLDEDLRGVFVNGLCPGNWKILRNGSLAMKRKVTDSAQCTYFEGLESGAYHLTKIN
ncbi:MAG: hypothetical protein JXQ80_08745, partial [Bacteroidales bacterium]|nr:hypothetical protein [Bacteroidales bacterium]